MSAFEEIGITIQQKILRMLKDKKVYEAGEEIVLEHAVAQRGHGYYLLETLRFALEIDLEVFLRNQVSTYCFHTGYVLDTRALSELLRDARVAFRVGDYVVKDTGLRSAPCGS